MPLLTLQRMTLHGPEQLVRALQITYTSCMECMEAEGFIAGKVCGEPTHVLWTMTLWDNGENAKKYVYRGAHMEGVKEQAALSKEAVNCHVDYDSTELPSWDEGYEILRRNALFTDRLENPGENHINRIVIPPADMTMTFHLSPKQ